MTKGELVPDDVTIAMIRERLSRPDCKKGAILDGFPRTPAQAEALEAMLQEFDGRVDVVPFIKAEESVLIDRLGSRWTCRAEGHIFNEKTNPPKYDKKCDFDGSDLYQRDDDKAETVKRRIEVYYNQTSPLIDHYRDRGKLVQVDGARSIDKVAQDLLVAVKKQYV
jgi:adenylate kinase